VTKSLTKLAIGAFLLLLVAGITNRIFAQQASLAEEKTSFDIEVMVKVAVPEGNSLSGTAIITLEDTTVQDTASVPLASVKVDASTLVPDHPAIAIPVNPSLVNMNADINVAVHIDTDENGRFSDGDWISDAIVNVITNDKTDAVVGIVRIGA